jgi:hypothetical protein
MIGDFEPTQKFNGVQSQDLYIQQFKEILVKGFSGNGYKVVQGNDNSAGIDLIISGKFIAMDNGDSKQREYFGPGKSGSKVFVTGRIPESGDIIFSFTDMKSSTKEEASQDELSRNILAEGQDIVNFLSRNSQKNPQPQAQPQNQTFNCSTIEGKRTAYTMLYVNDKRVTTTIINVELQKFFLRKNIEVKKIDYKIEEQLRSCYSDSFAYCGIQSLPDSIISQLKNQKIDFLLLLYGVSDQSPKAQSTKPIKMTTTRHTGPIFGNNSLVISMRTDDIAIGNIGQPNKFESIFCRLSLIDLQNNKTVLAKDLWVDKNNCKSEIVNCMVMKIYNTIGESSDTKVVPCLK